MPLADDELTFQVIGCYRRVYNELGFGLLESGYVGALSYECTKTGLRVDRELSVPLYYDSTIVANYRVDLVVDRRLIIEVKACKAILPEHIKQVFHYLKATDFELALLFNFGKDPTVKRFTLRNSLKDAPVDSCSFLPFPVVSPETALAGPLSLRRQCATSHSPP